MGKRLSEKLHYFKSSFRTKIFSYILLPVLILIFLSVYLNQYYLKVIRGKTEEDYLKTLSGISSNINSSMYELFNTSTLLYSYDDLKDMLYSNKPLSLQDYYSVTRTTNLLSRFKVTKQFIDSAYILKKPDNLILGSSGTAPADYFYNNLYNYQNYDYNFWLNLSPKNQDIITLNVSTVRNLANGDITKVIPIIQFNTNNIFVTNIKESYISNVLRQNRLTKNSTLFMFDKDGNILSQTYSNDEYSLASDSNLLSSIKQNKSILNAKINNRNYLIVKYQNFENILGDVTYAAVIPYDDLVRESRITMTLPFLMIMLGIIFSIIITSILSKKIYSPIGNLTTMLKANKKSIDEGDLSNPELDFLESEINNIINSNIKLTNNLSFVLPIVCEQYLFDILSDNRLYLDEEINNFLSEYGISFKYDYFAVIKTRIVFSTYFYEHSNKEDYLTANKNLIRFIKTMFPEEFQIYVLTVEKDEFCIIINLPKEDYELEIMDSIKHIHSILNIDENLLHISSAIGKIHKHFSGLQHSYKEALKAATLISPSKSETIKMYEPIEYNYKYIYSMDEENKLFNYLVSGNKENVDKLLNTIIDNNIKENINESELKKLYIQLYSTGIKALNLKNLSPNELMENMYIDVISDMNILSVREISQYVVAFLNRLTDYNLETTKKINMLEIRNYLDENYSSDIYLDQLADKYGISSKYMSKLLKDSLGISFQQYLSNLRINKAKEILKSSKKTIDDVAAEVGFNSRNTFIRTFKNLEGITPGEYRKLHSDKQNMHGN